MSEHRPNGCCDYHRHIADGCCHCESSETPAQPPAAPESDVSALWALSTPSLWESPDARSIPTLLAAIGQVLQQPSEAARERVRVVEGERDRLAAREAAARAEERERTLREFRRLAVRCYPKGMVPTPQVIADLNERIAREVRP